MRLRCKVIDRIIFVKNYCKLLLPVLKLANKDFHNYTNERVTYHHGVFRSFNGELQTQRETAAR